MFFDRELNESTKHDKIYIAQPDGFDHAKLNKDIAILERLSELMDKEKILDKLKDMVPGFRLDKKGR